MSALFEPIIAIRELGWNKWPAKVCGIFSDSFYPFSSFHSKGKVKYLLLSYKWVLFTKFEMSINVSHFELVP